MTGSENVFEAIDAGEVEPVRELVARDPGTGSARDAEGVSALMRARYLGRLDLVEALLEGKPDLDVFEAAALGEADRLRELLAENDELVRARSGDGFTALHLAAFFGQPEAARLLVERGADATAVAENAMRVQPLHSAAAAGQVEICALLLDAGADPNARQQAGFLPLQAPAQSGAAALAELLLARGADPSLASDDGRTAQEVARDAGHLELAAILRP